MIEQLSFVIEVPQTLIESVLQPKTMQERHGTITGARCGECALIIDSCVFEFVGPIKAFEKKVHLCGRSLQRVHKTTCACGKMR